MLSAGHVAPRGSLDSQWGSAALEDLRQQLLKAGYDATGKAANITPDTADLIGQLFGDVLKGAKYGKTARQLIEVRNQRILDLERQLTNTKSTIESAPADGTTLERLDDEQKHRIYRLLYLANTAIELLGKVAPNQANLLTELIEKDKSGNFGARGETADYWKIVSERDQLRAETKDKDEVIADLLASGNSRSSSEIIQKLFVSSRSILSTEEQLVKAIQSLKSSSESSSEKKKQVVEIESEEVKRLQADKKELETELKHVQKSFAQHLKQCESQKDENETNNENSSDVMRQRARLQAALNERQEDCRALNRRVHELEVDLAQKEKSLLSMKQEETHFREELAALITRCDLFENEFSQLEARRLDDDHKIKLMESDLAEYEALKQAHAENEIALETAQLSFLSTDRALSDARDEVTALRMDLAKLNEVKDMMETEASRLRKQVSTANGALERLNQVLRELKNKCRERDIEHVHLEQMIKLKEKELQETCATNEELQNALKTAQDNEDAALLDKDEALRTQEQYRNALKDVKKKMDAQAAELVELKGRNRFLVTQLADRMDTQMIQGPPETVMRIQKEVEDDETPQLVSEVAGLRVENKLLREKLASSNIILQKAISARKDAQTIAASESMTAAKYKAALDDMSDRQLTCSYPPTGWSNRDANSTRRQITANFLGQESRRREPMSASMTSESVMSDSLHNARQINSLSYGTSSEGFTSSSGRYASVFAHTLPTDSASNNTLSSQQNSITPQTITTGQSHDGASIRTQIGSIGTSSITSFPRSSRTPPQSVSTDTQNTGSSKTCNSQLTSGIRPTPIPKARSPTKGSTLSFTERAMARIHQIMNDVDEESDGSGMREINEDETPRHSKASNPSECVPNSYITNLADHIERQMPSFNQSLDKDAVLLSTTGGDGELEYQISSVQLPSRKRLYLNDEDLGHGGGYYWSPPQVLEEPESLSVGSLTYTNPTTNRSLTTLGGDNTDRGRSLLDGWITERTSNH